MWCVVYAKWKVLWRKRTTKLSIQQQITLLVDNLMLHQVCYTYIINAASGICRELKSNSSCTVYWYFLCSLYKLATVFFCFCPPPTRQQQMMHEQWPRAKKCMASNWWQPDDISSVERSGRWFCLNSTLYIWLRLPIPRWRMHKRITNSNLHPRWTIVEHGALLQIPCTSAYTRNNLRYSWLSLPLFPLVAYLSRLNQQITQKTRTMSTPAPVVATYTRGSRYFSFLAFYPCFPPSPFFSATPHRRK